MASGSGNDSSLIQRAAALRVKYRVNQETVRVPPGLVGFHPANRNGEPPNGDRCCALFGSIVEDGLDEDEADCGGVLLQEKPGSTRFHDYNVKACEGNELLKALVNDLLIMYGSCVHSHLSQIFKNCAAGAIVSPTVVGKSKKVRAVVDDTRGCVSMPLLETQQPVIADYCRKGVLWDILHWKLEEEESNGPYILAAAGNVKNANFMIPHEMEVIKSLSKWCKEQASMSAQVSFEACKQQLGVTLRGFVEDPDFMHVFRLIVDLGGDSSPFVKDLSAFTGRFVDPSTRRLRLAQFAVVANLPLNNPLLKIAMLKWSYAQQPRNGYCPVADSGRIKYLRAQVPDVLNTCEKCLSYFRGVAALAVAGLDAFQRTQFLGNLDKKIVTALLAPDGKAKNSAFYAERFGEVLRQMMAVASELHQGPVEFPDPPVKVPEAASSSNSKPHRGSGEPEAKVPKILPKVIQFDAEGKPTTEQETRVDQKKRNVETIAWAAWGEGEIQTEKNRTASAKALVQNVLFEVHRKTFTADVPIRMEREKDVRCIATTSLKIGALRVPAVVLHPTSLMETASKHFHSVSVECKELGASAGKPKIFHLSPEFSLPKTPEVAGENLEWKPVHSAHLFWGIARDHREENWNCELIQVPVNNIQALGFSASEVFQERVVLSQTTVVTVPVITNTRAVQQGEELVLKWKEPPQKEKKVKEKTWMTEAKDAAKEATKSSGTPIKRKAAGN